YRGLLQLPAHSFGGKQSAASAIRNFDLLKNPFVGVQRGLTTTDVKGTSFSKKELKDISS
ncbi:hypothetical protein P0D69_45345, partial [Paraburkholderia sediminicola]|uniref:hypothetical protein n=1 Tax=Paraburkholderia sediminicola TaxID=458836 RepID=UPI0038BBD7A9